jgi:predicted glycoside hydrolase/deacetylase ChbG (UPF0249 family)
MATRSLIVNADDFGLTPGVNAGVARAHEDGILTSASLMVRWPAAQEAADYAAGAPDLGVGLHVDLGEWEFRDGKWVQLYHVVDTTDAAAVEQEIRAQLDAFTRLTGRAPTHIDSHQHVHKHEPEPVFRRLAAQLGLPLRDYTPGVNNVNFYGRTKRGAMLGAGVSVERLLEIVTSLSPGITEIGCHPGIDGDTGSVYDVERQQEVEILCDPRVREALAREGVVLRSFADIEPRAKHDR